MEDGTERAYKKARTKMASYRNQGVCKLGLFDSLGTVTQNLNNLATSLGATSIEIQATLANSALARALRMGGWSIESGGTAPYLDTIRRTVK